MMVGGERAAYERCLGVFKAIAANVFYVGPSGSGHTIKLAEHPTFVAEVYERLMEYYTRLVLKYKKAGAHMITAVEDIGSTSSLLIRPDVWREYFKPTTQKFFKYIHDQGLYTGICIDGNSRDVLDDLLEMDIDLFTVVDIRTTGIDTIRDKVRGKLCLKATVDMQSTLALGTPEDVQAEAEELVGAFNTPQGGFICQVVRWHRPAYPEANVLASARGFNRYRRGQ